MYHIMVTCYLECSTELYHDDWVTKKAALYCNMKNGYRVHSTVLYHDDWLQGMQHYIVS